MSGSLTIYDFSDRELLYAIGENLNEDGVISTHDLAAAVGLDRDSGRFAGSRLAWMRRYGVIEKTGHDANSGTLWTLTRLGRDLLNGTLSASQRTALAAVTDAQRVTLMEGLASRAKSSKKIKPLLRRSWQNGIGR